VTLSGTVFIDRANRSSALKTFDNAVKQMKRNKVHYYAPYCSDYDSKVYGFSQKEHVPTPIALCCFLSKREHSISLFKPVFQLFLSLLQTMNVFSVLKNDVLRVELSRFKVSIYSLFLLLQVWRRLVLDPIPTTDLSSSDVDRIAGETRDKMLNVLEQISSTTNNHPVNGTVGVKKGL